LLAFTHVPLLLSNTKSPIIRSLTALYNPLDETDRSQVAFDMQPTRAI
jgi:hypothetical protein